MLKNNSPWIHQLDHERATYKLGKDLKVDVAIVGGGIAGVSTAFYLLKNTKKSIAILEGYKLAHGATGHNAGHLVSYFERPFADIVREFGLDMACEAQKDINSAWELLDEIYTEAGLDIPLLRFESYAGLSTKAQILSHLENDFVRRSGGLHTKPVEIWEECPFLSEIPEKYHPQVQLISREEIALKLETFDPQYVAVLSTHKGVMNSALFCQEVALYLLEKYPDRFNLYEETPINKVVIHEDSAILDALSHTVECEKVVLCTNGFSNIEIFTSSGLSVNTRFHHSLQGVVGFMSGYLESHTGIPAALSYFPKIDPGLTHKSVKEREIENYFYVTRRPYEYEKNIKHNLVCVGGPEVELEEVARYDRNREFSEKARGQISDFLKATYEKKDLEFLFTWHGLMGYTKNLLRMIGPDPAHQRLLYNLGCNGVGLLPSIFGGLKISKIIAGEKLRPSIFDVPLVLEGGKAPAPSPARP